MRCTLYRVSFSHRPSDKFRQARSRLVENSRYNPKKSLDAELLKEGHSRKPVIGRVCVWIEQRASHDAKAEQHEPPTNDLAREASEGASGDGAQVRHDLGDRDTIRAIVVLVLQQGRVEVLRSVGLDRT
jgi:hypothetical protein